MSRSIGLSAPEIRDKIGHPIIDGDGHVVETPIVLLDYVKQIAGSEVAARYEKMGPWFRKREFKEIFGECPLGQTQ